MIPVSNEGDELDVAPERNFLRCTTTVNAKYAPAGRYGHTATMVGGTQMLVFGGGTHDGKFCEDVAVWHLEQLRWVEPVNGLLDGSGRNFHVACEWEGALYVFGGKANGYRNDVWRWREGDGWTQVKQAAGAAQPDARWGHAACLVGSRWYIHGGYDSNAFYLNDLWCFDFTTMRWERIEQCGGKHVPDARQHHTLVHATPKRLHLFGGKNNEGACKAIVHVLNLDTHEWSELKPMRTLPVRSAAKQQQQAVNAPPAPRWCAM